MIDRDVVSEDQLRDDLSVADLPDHGLRHGLQPGPGSAGKRSRKPSSASRWEGSALAEEFVVTVRGPVHSDHVPGRLAVIRTIDEANGVVYECN